MVSVMTDRQKDTNFHTFYLPGKWKSKSVMLSFPTGNPKGTFRLTGIFLVADGSPKGTLNSLLLC